MVLIKHLCRVVELAGRYRHETDQRPNINGSNYLLLFKSRYCRSFVGPFEQIRSGLTQGKFFQGLVLARTGQNPILLKSN